MTGRTTSDLSERHKKTIKQMNLSYLVLARELATESIPKACVILGLSRNEATILRDCPISHLHDVVTFPAVFFNFRNNYEFWDILRKGKSPDWEKSMLTKLLTESE